VLTPEDLEKLQRQVLTPEDLEKLQIDDKAKAGREKTRLTKSTGQSIKDGAGKIGGPFTLAENPAFLAERLQTYEALAAKRKAELEGAWSCCVGFVLLLRCHGWFMCLAFCLAGRPGIRKPPMEQWSLMLTRGPMSPIPCIIPHAAKPKEPITITLPDGSVKEGTAWVTTPYDIAAGIAQGLADSAVVAKVGRGVACVACG
jgi:hypothetical protein